MSLSTTQSKGYIAAWLGWMFDGMDGVMYTLVAIPFVTQLMGLKSVNPSVQANSGVIQACFMFGWALGGAVFGRLCDRIGRKKTLTYTILTFALFTALSGFATSWQMLALFRFVAALGIGGEWAAGASLVSETLHDKHRPWASALLQTGYQIGYILAAVATSLIPGWMIAQGLPDWKYRAVFLVGVFPAFLTLWLRKAVPESGEWEAARANQAMPSVGDLFGKTVLPTTLKVLVFLSICLTAVWTFVYFFPQVLRSQPEVKALGDAGAAALIGQVVIVSQLWNIAGNFAATYSAKLFGPRATFVAFMAAGLACAWLGFATPHPLSTTVVWINAFAFSGLGLFGIFPLYVPSLFPTLVRTTGAGFCYNFGRVVAGLGTLLGSSIIANLGPSRPIAYCGLLLVPGIVLALFMPSTLERPDA